MLSDTLPIEFLTRRMPLTARLTIESTVYFETLSSSFDWSLTDRRMSKTVGGVQGAEQSLTH